MQAEKAQNLIAEVHDSRPCELGEGVLWHPLRKQLFWFDILGKQLLSRHEGELLSWEFEELVSAAGWVDRETLLIASESGLYRFNLLSGEQQLICELESRNSKTRSNDGRADPSGGFWIGTMSKVENAGEGAIYRYYRGQLRKLHSGVSIPNSICFTPDGGTVYFTDTSTNRIMRQPLDGDGWPAASPDVFIDLSAEGLFPDGSVVDSQGGVWNAQWGAGRVARYLPDGQFDFAVTIGCTQSTCPAFGGEALSTLFITSAFRGLTEEKLQGVTYSVRVPFTGWPEPRVILD